MEQYIATFHTHLAALRTCNALKKQGVGDARLAPVPRKLSSSCGTCAMYQGTDPMLSCMDVDVEAVYRREGEGFVLLHKGAD